MTLPCGIGLIRVAEQLAGQFDGGISSRPNSACMPVRSR
jgi:hypothetical protein